MYEDKFFIRDYDIEHGWWYIRCYETCSGDSLEYSWMETPNNEEPFFRFVMRRSIDKQGNELWILVLKVHLDLAIEEEMEF